MDILLLTERIQQTIELGESQFREFKSAWEGQISDKRPREPKMVAKDIAETLVAFANADGGELLIGVEDDGTITGFSYKEDTVTKLLEAPKRGVHPHTPLESTVARRVKLEDKEILYFSVEKSTTTVHQTSDGKCLQRKDAENRPVSAVQLQFERHEQISREYDRQFVDGAQVRHLNHEIVSRVSAYITKMSAEKCLQYLGLAEYGMGILQLRRAALLLFAKDVSHWHPRCQVRIVRIKGTELKTGREYNVVSDETATGNILELITSAWEKLRPHLVETKLTPHALFQERVMYPEDACREALINAITHRSYSIEGQNIEILIFDDRMEVQSPGGLLSTIKIDKLTKLQGVHESRNALIARVLREIGYVREMGEGMRRIFQLMQDADLVPPELRSEPSRFTIILRHKSVFSDADQRWLDGFRPLKPTRQEMLIALMGKNGNLLAPQEVYDRLNLVDWDVYRSIIDQILTKGIVYNAMSQQEKVKRARARKVSQRAIPRLAVRQPEELEKALSELFDVIKRNGKVSLVDTAYDSMILNELSVKNPYRTDPLTLSKLLKLLGLIDDNRRPTSHALNLWGEDFKAIQPRRKPRAQRGSRKPIDKPVTQRDVFVGNLDYSTTSEELKQLFEKYGEVVSVSIPIDFVTQRGRGFGFAKMATEADAEHVIKELNGSIFRGRVLRLDW
jgi:ATP-dependent DNA helicase RecG